MLFGQDLDDLFGYETKKIVRIRDRRLGVTYFALVLLIASYVIGFQILYSNEHFQRKDVYGTARMTIQQPTKGACNPNKRGCKSDFPALTVLPYCSVYKGNSTEVDSKNRHDCIFADQHTLAPTGMLTGEMLVPTRIDRMTEHKGCEPGPANGYTCDNEYELDHDENVIYVADIEKFTIMLSHTYKRRYLQGNNQWTQGYLLECKQADSGRLGSLQQEMKRTIKGRMGCDGKYEKTPIECITDNCPFLLKSGKEKKRDSFFQRRAGVDPAAGSTARKGRAAPASRHGIQPTLLKLEEHTEQAVNPAELAKSGFFAIPSGDVFRIDKLLELAGVSLDNTFNVDGEPLREAGTVLEIEAIYTNLVPWLSSFGLSDVSYSYKVSTRPMEEMKTELFAQDQPDFPAKRVIENRHGLYIVCKISGEFGFFSIVYLGVMLTTAVALISVAILITDKLAIYVLPEKATYYQHKYEVTECLFPEEGLRREHLKDHLHGTPQKPTDSGASSYLMDLRTDSGTPHYDMTRQDSSSTFREDGAQSQRG